MKFDIITIFPEIFNSFLKESLMSRALKKKIIKINVHNLRDWAKGNHKMVDDRPFGGGSGMVLKPDPIFRAVSDLKKKNSKVILFTPRGKKLNQKIVKELFKAKHLIMICGRYEGIDERVLKHVSDLNLSLGDYVLMGGELPAMVLVECITRLVPKALGNKDSLKGFLEYPQYTRPEVFEGHKVPKVLLSGNHKKINEWRQKKSKLIE